MSYGQNVCRIQSNVVHQWSVVMISSSIACKGKKECYAVSGLEFETTMQML